MSFIDMTLYPELIEAARKNKLIIFVGAGLSYNLINKQGIKIEGWKTYISNMIEYLNKFGFDLHFMLPLLDKCEPMEILPIIEKRCPIDKVINFTKKYFDIDKNGDVNCFTLQNSLFRLSSKIVTINYDDAFEIANPEVNVIYRGYEVTEAYTDDSPFLFKLHGTRMEGDSMVIFPSQYNKLYSAQDGNAENKLHLLKTIISTNRVIFIGCGMGISK